MANKASEAPIAVPKLTPVSKETDSLLQSKQTRRNRNAGHQSDKNPATSVYTRLTFSCIGVWQESCKTSHANKQLDKLGC